VGAGAAQRCDPLKPHRPSAPHQAHQDRAFSRATIASTDSAATAASYRGLLDAERTLACGKFTNLLIGGGVEGKRQRREIVQLEVSVQVNGLRVRVLETNGACEARIVAVRAYAG